MDEIDAALDFKNTGMLARFIKNKVTNGSNVQYIVVSLRKQMYQQCNKLFGVYKVKDQSSVVGILMNDLIGNSKTN